MNRFFESDSVPSYVKVGVTVLLVAGAAYLIYVNMYMNSRIHSAITTFGDSSRIGGGEGLTRHYAAMGATGTLCGPCQYVGGNGQCQNIPNCLSR